MPLEASAGKEKRSKRFERDSGQRGRTKKELEGRAGKKGKNPERGAGRDFRVKRGKVTEDGGWKPLKSNRKGESRKNG